MNITVLDFFLGSLHSYNANNVHLSMSSPELVVRLSSRNFYMQPGARAEEHAVPRRDMSRASAAVAVLSVSASCIRPKASILTNKIASAKIIIMGYAFCCTSHPPATSTARPAHIRLSMIETGRFESARIGRLFVDVSARSLNAAKEARSRRVDEVGGPGPSSFHLLKTGSFLLMQHGLSVR